MSARVAGVCIVEQLGLVPDLKRSVLRGSEAMRSPNLQLTLSGSDFSMTPLPHTVDSPCNGDRSCRNRASHRLLMRPTAVVALLCDVHVLDWAAHRGHHVTTARSSDSAA